MNVPRIKRFLYLLAAWSAVWPAATLAAAPAQRPNVIVVIVDDMGYGDISAHGNPVLKTPHLDALHRDSVRFTDFHVAPVCTPTRSELMTGLNAFRNGATFVCEGLSLPRRELKLLPQFFREGGYATGHFGKWHLGDNYPFRPHDRGFDVSVRNGAWGIKSLAEHWQNDGFDDIYWRNDTLERFPGYNTDAFFGAAMDWMARQKRPFFVYLALTAPHEPFVAPEADIAPYRDRDPKLAAFLGMIANFDANMGRLERFLAEKRLKENTALIFMTDNGTVLGHTIHNAGMRGSKRSSYDGGHRVPLFLRWPAGGLGGGRDVDVLAHATDLLPTLVDLCGLPAPTEKLDGHSLKPALDGRHDALNDRMAIVQYGRAFQPWEGAVLWQKWRLVQGRELYNVASDPGQQTDVAARHPEVVQAMRGHYEAWAASLQPTLAPKHYVTIGTPHEPVTWLSAANWTGSYADNLANLAQQNTPGHWNLEVATGGEYRISLYLFHPEAAAPLDREIVLPDSLGNVSKVPMRPIAQASLLIDDAARSIAVPSGATHATFDVTLAAGRRLKLEGRFLDRNGRTLCGAFYTFVQKKDAAGNAADLLRFVSAPAR